MGCFDTILVPCPGCGELHGAQSKSGDRRMRVFKFQECPEDVMVDVNRHAPFTCFTCGTIFEVELSPMPKIVVVEQSCSFI
jgi:Fe2+ or Zn2+ uptake regulation protein